MQTTMNGATAGGTSTSTSTAANVRSWAGHRQAFPLGQSHTPLTSMPTLGRALTDGNLNEVGFVNTFLQHLAQQSGTVEDDSDEDTKYEEEDDESRRRDYHHHHHHYSPSYEDDDEDYYSRNKKRRTRWRANYPKIKKTKRTGDASSSSPSAPSPSSSSFSRRRASVSAPSSAYTTSSSGSGSSAMRRKEQRSNSVSSYFAMRNTEEEQQQGSPMLQPSPSSVFGCDSHLSSSPEQQQRQLQQTHPLARADFEQPEWVTATSLPSCGGPDLPAVPSPPPLHYPIGLPSIQPLYPPNPHHPQHHHPHHHQRHHQQPAPQQHNLQRSSSSPAILPPYSYTPARGPAAEYYSPQHYMPQQSWTAHAASAAMPPPAPIVADPSSAMDEEVEVLESSSGQAPFDYSTAQVNQATTPSQTEDEGSWLEDLLRLEHPSSAVDSSSFPSTPLSPSCPNHTHTGGQHPAASKDAAFYAELFGY